MKKVQNIPNKNYGGVEARLARQLDKKSDILRFYEEYWPLIKKAAQFRNIDEMLRNFSPISVLVLIRQAMEGKSEAIRQNAAIQLLHMSEGKPVQKTLVTTRNVDKMPEKEVDSMIRGLLRAASRENAVTVKSEPVPEEATTPEKLQ